MDVNGLLWEWFRYAMEVWRRMFSITNCSWSQLIIATTWKLFRKVGPWIAICSRLCVYSLWFYIQDSISYLRSYAIPYAEQTLKPTVTLFLPKTNMNEFCLQFSCRELGTTKPRSTTYFHSTYTHCKLCILFLEPIWTFDIFVLPRKSSYQDF